MKLEHLIAIRHNTEDQGKIINELIELIPQSNKEERMQILNSLERIQNNLDNHGHKATTFTQLIPTIWS